VVRPHPLDDGRRWLGLSARDARVVVSWPWEGSGGLPGPFDQTRLVSTLLHADVCVNAASTMSLDAAVLDTPVVCVAFRRREDVYTEHYRPIVESGGVRVACDSSQLVAELKAYVRDRFRDAAGRRKLVASECGPVDGKAAMRIAELIGTLCEARSFRDATP
jgi:hypothetical protein